MNSEFAKAVYALVAQIPPGKVMSYGQIAALCGHPGAARVVGQIAHFRPSDLPWQRVVNASGGMASGFLARWSCWAGRMLAAEGTQPRNDKVNMKESVWWPKHRALAIVGPTASGKTSLALDIAEAFNGEIIAVDSANDLQRTRYWYGETNQRATSACTALGS